MNYSKHTPTEECPLTKERKKCSLNNCCDFRGIICCFITLSSIITAALILQLVYDDNAFMGRLNAHGAVATDFSNCSLIGTKILRKGGNAVDAAVAATICMTVVAPYKTSLGSGGYIMIYDHKTQNTPVIIDFLSNTNTNEFVDAKIRLPALLRGLEYAQNLYGKLFWKELLQPSIKIARDGFHISSDFAYEATKNNYDGVFAHLSAGEILTLPILADTLEAVALNGVNVFYNGSITKQIFDGRPITQKLLQQLADYQPQVSNAGKSSLSHYAIYHLSNLTFTDIIIEDLNHINYTVDSINTIESDTSIAEMFLDSNFGNPEMFHSETRRYTGVASVDWEDIYVAVITGLSASLDLSHKTSAGFYLDTPDNIAMLSLSPIIFYDEKAVCGLRGVFSTDDTIVTGQILYNLLFKNLNVSAAVEYPRYYLMADGLTLENNDRHMVPIALSNYLLTKRKLSQVDANLIMKSVNTIVKKKNLINGHSDSRGDGLASRF